MCNPGRRNRRARRGTFPMTSEPLPVLLVHHTARRGGAEQGLLDVLDALPRERFAPLAALPSDGDLADEVHARGVPTVRIPLRRLRRTADPLRLAAGAVRLAVSVAALSRLLRARNVALVHANSDQAQLAAGSAAARAGIPCLWHSRDLAPLGRLGPWMCRRATRMLAVSRSVRDRLLAWGPHPDRVTLLYNGISIDRFAPPAPGAQAPGGGADLGLDARDFVVAMGAHLAPWKRHDVFIDAAAAIREAVPRARFVIAGTDLFGDRGGGGGGGGAQRALRRRANARGLGDRLFFAGALPDLRPLLARADVLVHPAAREPFGRVVAEAMAMETPVVAVNDAGPGEIIRHETDGLLVPGPDPAALAAAVVRLHRDPALARRLGAAARQRIREAFSFERFAAQLVAEYGAVLAAGRGENTA
jgi:glycosyltransferase involved in cell wall biosynthesis